MFDPRIVKAEMARREITFKELAVIIGKSESGLRKMLGKNGNPTIQNIEAIAKALNCSPSIFFITQQHYSVEPERVA